MLRYCTTILLGAFLLFQVQPQIARFILPWFGGGAAVWSTCMLFFQVLLLGGYGYAHLISKRLRPQQQAVLHVCLLAASCIFLPATPAESWKPTGDENPVFHILTLLSATVGLPYLLLASTGPLLQSWFAKEFEGRSPYRLYSLSNFGSLAALISFPFLFEPNLSIALQADLWAGAYVVFAVASTVCAVHAARRLPAAWQEASDAVDPDTPLPTTDTPAASPNQTAAATDWSTTSTGPATAVATPTVTATAEEVARPTVLPATNSPAPAVPAAEPMAPAATQRLAWLGLATLPSLMLLAVTNMVCQDVAVVPFFWVMPLAAYLLTFILTFDSDRWYRPRLLAPILVAAATFTGAALSTNFLRTAVYLQALLYMVVLFTCGMVCHGELVKRRPVARYLTSFYLTISLGGALGGLAVAVVAPMVFNTFTETLLGLIACAGVATWAAWRYRPLRIASLGTVLVAIVVGIWLRTGEAAQSTQSRNFYGSLTVESHVELVAHGGQMLPRRTISLTHGSTLHGREVSGVGLQPHDGLTYYQPGSAVHYALQNHPLLPGPLRIGVVGLGGGSLAYYAKPGDHFTYYEIDPAVAEVAESRFSYLRSARERGARVDVTLGDARIRLERELQSSSHQFDILVVDAFSSDAIPMHLLTRECNDLYWKHLKTDGILLIHISNYHLDLTPVARGLARQHDKEVRIITSQLTDIGRPLATCWAIITDNREFLQAEAMQMPASNTKQQATILWTDDFASLWHVLR